MAAAKRPNLGAILAVFDGGDFKTFPAGSASPFCPFTAAKSMADSVSSLAKGKNFSLAVVFACKEYETWLIAGAKSFVGRSLKDGRPALPPNASLPACDPESHGKGWLEKTFPNYRPTRDQGALTELLELKYVRDKNLRSFQRLEHAIDQLLNAVASGAHIATPFEPPKASL